VCSPQPPAGTGWSPYPLWALHHVRHLFYLISLFSNVS
jgi:hypothetical protein